MNDNIDNESFKAGDTVYVRRSGDCCKAVVEKKSAKTVLCRDFYRPSRTFRASLGDVFKYEVSLSYAPGSCSLSKYFRTYREVLEYVSGVRSSRGSRFNWYSVNGGKYMNLYSGEVSSEVSVEEKDSSFAEKRSAVREKLLGRPVYGHPVVVPVVVPERTVPAEPAPARRTLLSRLASWFKAS